MNHLRKYLGACVAIVAGVVILIVVMYSARFFSDKPAPSLPSEPEPVPMRLVLSLKTSDGIQTLSQGEPFTVQVTLADEWFLRATHSEEDQKKKGDGRTGAVTLGTGEWPWFDGLVIRFERIEKQMDGKERTVPVLEDLDWANQINVPRPGSHIENQLLHRPLVCVFSIGPHVSQSLAPGRYVLKAMWDGTKPEAQDMNIWHGRLEAEPMDVIITTARTYEEEGKLAFSRASYYMHQGNYDLALEEALKAEELNPSYGLWHCYDMAARAYQRKGDIKSAAKYYRKFVDAHKDTNPDRYPYILKVRHRLERLEKELDDSR